MAKRSLVLLVFLVLLLALSCPRAAADPSFQYDGIWLLGFNLKFSPFNGPNSLVFRRAIAAAIDRAAIARDIFNETLLPGGFIPPEMPGYDPALAGPAFDQTKARQLLEGLAGHLPKNIVLVHTDGVKTVAAAKAIQADLAKVGLTVELKEEKYETFSSFDHIVNLLKKGRAQMFLMGFKAEMPWDTLSLLQPLFSSKGEDNFTSYKNTQVDGLLAQAAVSDRAARGKFLAAADQIISQDLPAVGLFYIRLMAGAEPAERQDETTILKNNIDSTDDAGSTGPNP